MTRNMAWLVAATMGCTNSGLADLAGMPAIDDDGASDAVPGEFIIGADVPEALAIELGIELIERDEHGSALYTGSEADLWTLQRRLKEDIDLSVEVEPNRLRQAYFVANDPLRNLQWHLDVLDMDTVWDLSRGAGVVVAVVDSGLWTGGVDTPLFLTGGWDFISNDSDPHDSNGHGTHVAGTVAQASNNGVGAAGVAPEATVMPVRVLDTAGWGTSWSIAQGIDFATAQGADVINMSLGSSYSSSQERAAIDRAVSAGVVVVAATGNEGWNQVSYPAAYPGVIGVGATGGTGSVTSYSNGGSGTDVVAPGGDLWRDANGDGYGDGVLQETHGGFQFFEGTSMASPHVAGVAAVLLSAGANPADVPGLLMSTASNGGSWQTRSGYGLVDPVAALAAIGVSPGGGGGTPPPPPPPPPSDSTPPTISDIAGWRSGASLTLTWTTDEPTTTAVEFDTYGRYNGGSGLTTDHEMRFTLSTYETYWFRIAAEDGDGNSSLSATWVTYP